MLAPVISMQNVELVYEDLFYFDNLGSEISMFFPSYILATVLTPRHTNLMLKSFTFSKT